MSSAEAQRDSSLQKAKTGMFLLSYNLFSTKYWGVVGHGEWELVESCLWMVALEWILKENICEFCRRWTPWIFINWIKAIPDVQFWIMKIYLQVIAMIKIHHVLMASDLWLEIGTQKGLGYLGTFFLTSKHTYIYDKICEALPRIALILEQGWSLGWSTMEGIPSLGLPGSTGLGKTLLEENMRICNLQFLHAAAVLPLRAFLH